jgi:hypothetical protein
VFSGHGIQGVSYDCGDAVALSSVAVLPIIGGIRIRIPGHIRPGAGPPF